jgi:hypothetical protein
VELFFFLPQYLILMQNSSTGMGLQTQAVDTRMAVAEPVMKKVREFKSKCVIRISFFF